MDVQKIALGGAAIGGIGAFASMEYMEKQAQLLKEQEERER
jgi:uncharacterized protein YcfJ